jgi:hypothetical protein
VTTVNARGLIVASLGVLMLATGCSCKDKQLSVEPSGDHGVSLLNDHVTGLIDKFLTDH